MAVRPLHRPCLVHSRPSNCVPHTPKSVSRSMRSSTNTPTRRSLTNSTNNRCAPALAIRCSQRPVGTLLGQAQESQGTTARSWLADKQAGCRPARRQPYDRQRIAQQRAPQGTHLQRQGRVGILAARQPYKSFTQLNCHIHCERCNMKSDPSRSTRCARAARVLFASSLSSRPRTPSRRSWSAWVCPPRRPNLMPHDLPPLNLGTAGTG